MDEPVLIEGLLLPLNNMRKFGTNDNIESFGGPPTNSTTSLGDDNCYRMERSYELVLTRNPIVGPYDIAAERGCNWNIQWANNNKITEIPKSTVFTFVDDSNTPLPQHCNQYSCPPTLFETGPTITVTNLAGGLNTPGPHSTTPMPDFAEVCKRNLGNAWIDQEMKIKWKYKKIVTGCSDVIRSHIWPLTPDVGSLWSFANDLFCKPQSIHTDPGGLEEDAENTWKKILACLCEIENETDPEKKRKKEENLFKNINNCAEKWNKNASPLDQRIALFGPGAAGPQVSQSDEAIEDLTSIRYQECLSEVEDFCAAPK